MRLDRAFFDREVTEVARELIGVELMLGETGGIIVETEAYRPDDAASHAFNGAAAAQQVDVRPAGPCLCLPVLRHSLVPELRLPDRQRRALIRALEPTSGIPLDDRAPAYAVASAAVFRAGPAHPGAWHRCIS